MIYYLSKKKILFENNNINYDLRICDVINALSKEKVIALDTETTGRDPLVDKIIMLQIGTLQGNQYVIDARDYDIRKLKSLLEDKNKIIVGHNIKFDYNMLKRYNIVLEKVYDTMLSDIIIYNGYYSIDYIKKNKRFSLAGVTKHHLNIRLPKEVRNEFHTIGSSPFKLDHIIYGAKDVIYPLKIKDKQEHLINKFNLYNCISLENNVTLALADIEYNGFYIDRNKWKDISITYNNKIKDTIRQLDELVISVNPRYKKNVYQKDLFDSSYENRRLTNINWSSNDQVYTVLTQVFNIYPTDKHGKPSSGAKAIEYLPEKHKITDLLLLYREQSKILSTYGIEFLNKYIKSDNRVHTEFNQIVETGRVSSRNPNMQNIPRSELFRSCFIAPNNKKIITADYSNQEGRIMSDQANDKSYIDFFNNGDGDAHSFVATKMFSVAFGEEFIVTKNNENKDYRQKGKTINFAISYGGSAFSLSKDLKIPLEEAQELINNFYKGFPDLKKYFDLNWSFGINNGYILTNKITNRRRWFKEYEEYLDYKEKSKKMNSTPDYFKRFKKLEGSIGRKSMNSPIQGTAGDMTKSALVLIRKKLLNLGIRPLKGAEAKLVSVVHDECSLEVPKNKANTYANIQKKAMEEAVSLFVSKVKIPVDQKILDYWDH